MDELTLNQQGNEEINMSTCKKCKEKVNLLNAFVYLGLGWTRWVCPKCNYELNYERTNKIGE